MSASVLSMGWRLLACAVGKTGTMNTGGMSVVNLAEAASSASAFGRDLIGESRHLSGEVRHLIA